MRIAIFCASNGDDVPSFVRASEALVDAIAARGLGIVYGGARVGLMGVVARRALAVGVNVTGVIPRSLLDRELLMPGLDRAEVVETLAERKLLMSREADAFIALPGAIGTLDELLEEWTLHYLGVHEKPIGILDVDGYWTPFLAALEQMHRAGIVRGAHLEIPLVERDPTALVDRLLAHIAR